MAKNPRSLGTLTARKLDDIEPSREVLAALAPHPAEAPLNAAQHYFLARHAIRYRCTVGQLVVALALASFEGRGDGEHDAQDAHVLTSLTHFADGGLTPRQSLGPELPAVVDIGDEKQLREARERAHREDGIYVLYAAGMIDADELDKLSA